MKIRPWTLWSRKPPPRPGFYWLAAYWPLATEDSEPSTEPENPFVWEIDEEVINGRYDIQNIDGVPKENVLWFGPLLPPPFDK